MPFNIGPGELLLLVIVALLIFGPKKLPELGKALGESLGAFKKAISGEDVRTSSQDNSPSMPAYTPNDTNAPTASETSGNSENKR